MPGKKISDHQVHKFKVHRNTLSQVASAAKVGISDRSARRIEQGDVLPSQRPARCWRTRQDPLGQAWDVEVVPLLQADVTLNAVTLLEELQRRHPGQYDTAYELNELGIDPYYFTLHVTVDNADTGHAQRAVQAVLDTLPQLGDSAGFWRRVRNGFKLSNAGIGTTQVIAGFDLEQEVISIFSRKSVTGHGAHSGYCRVASRSVNDWLAEPENITGFLAALEQAGWLRRGAPVHESRFWKQLQGEKAEMFGVFSPYELQLIHDWIRGDASADGRAYDEPAVLAGRQCATFRAKTRLAQQQPGGRVADDYPLAGPENLPDGLLDPDLQALQAQIATLGCPQQQLQRLVQAMSPACHWTPAGLYATRQFLRLSA